MPWQPKLKETLRKQYKEINSSYGHTISVDLEKFAGFATEISKKPKHRVNI